MFRYKLRTLMIVLAIGPPVLAACWIYRVPLGISLALILAAGILGTVLGRTLLWGIEGFLAAVWALVAALRHATRRQRPPNADDAVEFSLGHFASQVKDRRKE